MSTYQNLLYEKQHRGVLITLNRPERRNALSEALLAELDAALAEAKDDPEVRGVILTGSGNCFSTGEDMSQEGVPETVWPQGLPEGVPLYKEFDKLRDKDRKDMLQRRLYRWEYPKPIIGAVNGWCLGTASWLALTCHLTVAGDDAVFGQPQVRQAAGTDFIWVLLAGPKNALRYALTGDHVDAQEALRIGLVNKVVPKEELLEECFRMVERVALVPPETVKINLAIATQGLEMMGLHKAWLLNAELSAMARFSKREEFNKRLEDARKQGGLRAFFEARDKPFRPEPFGPHSKGD